MNLETIVFLLILVIQISIGFYALSVKAVLAKRYSYILGSQSDLGRTLEKLIEKIRVFNVNVKVIKKLDVPVLAKNGDLLINKDSIYKTDLYSNLLVIFELETITASRNIKKITLWQNRFFGLSLVIFLVGLALNSTLGILIVDIAIVLQVLLIISSAFIYQLTRPSFENIHNLAAEVLELDNVEKARAMAMCNDLKLRFFEYPVQIFVKTVEFLKPV